VVRRGLAERVKRRLKIDRRHQGPSTPSNVLQLIQDHKLTRDVKDGVDDSLKAKLALTDLVNCNIRVLSLDS
jgi:hypothetical protein